MNKWCGKIGFVEQVETSQSVWTEVCKDRKYRGDILKRSFKWNDGSKVNDDVSLNIQISVLADSFLMENLGAMRYVCYGGSKWKITDISPDWPRITLTLGSLYNE